MSWFSASGPLADNVVGTCREQQETKKIGRLGDGSVLMVRWQIMWQENGDDKK